MVREPAKHVYLNNNNNKEIYNARRNRRIESEARGRRQGANMGLSVELVKVERL